MGIMSFNARIDDATSTTDKLFQIRLDGEIIHQGHRKDTQAWMVKFQQLHPEKRYKMEYLGNKRDA